MFACGWPITLLLFRLFGPVTSSPVSMYTPSPLLPLQISPPSPSNLPSLPASLPTPSFISSSGDSAERAHCHLTISPSTLVVRFEDPATANCSVTETAFSPIGWEGNLATPTATMDHFLVWSVDSMTEWNITAMCYALSDHGPCHNNLPVIVYKPPDRVAISFVNHTGPMFEGRHYTLRCEVQDVAPIENLIVTFYRGRTALGQLQSNNTKKTPVTETFSMDIIPGKEDDGAQYWCEAKLQLGPEGPQHPLVMSDRATATVYYKPQKGGLSHPDPISITEGESLSLNCSAVGNPSPSYTWTLPSASRPHSNSNPLVIHSVTSKEEGQYTCLASNDLGRINVTFNVVVKRLERTPATTTTETTTTMKSSTSSTRIHTFILSFMLLLHVVKGF